MRSIALVLLCSGCCLSVSEGADQTGGTAGGAAAAGNNAGNGGGTAGGGANASSTGGGGGGGGCTPGVNSLEVIPAQLDFGPSKINTSVRESVTLANCSDAPVETITTSIEGPDANLFTVLDAPTSLGANAQATVDISYAPLALEVQSHAMIEFTGGDGEKGSCTLQGQPFGVALTLGPNPVNFGYVPLGATAVACTTVTNVTNLDITITGITSFATAGNTFALATTDDSTPPNPFALPLTIQGGASAEVCFSFTPPITQQYQGQVTLETTDPSNTNPIVQLTGWAGGPQITCHPSSIDFAGDAGSIVPVTCSNSGTAIPGTNLTINPPIATPSVFAAEFDQEVNPYPLGGLAPGESAQIDVSYKPTAQSTDLGTLSIRSNGGQGRDLQIPLRGNGI